MNESLKVCAGCNQAKSVGEFPRNKNVRGGRDYRCKSCHRERMRARRSANVLGLPMPSVAKPKRPKPPPKAKKPPRPPSLGAETNVYNTYKHGAARRGLAFDLQFEEFRDLIYRACVVCRRRGANKHVYGKGRPGEYKICYTGIDRIDNRRGYVPGNVQPMCGTCNKAKARLGEAEFAEWIAAVKAHA